MNAINIAVAGTDRAESHEWLLHFREKVASISAIPHLFVQIRPQVLLKDQISGLTEDQIREEIE